MADPADIDRYIDAAAALHGLQLTPAQRERVIAQFALATAIVAPLLELAIAQDCEPASVFQP